MPNRSSTRSVLVSRDWPPHTRASRNRHQRSTRSSIRDHEWTAVRSQGLATMANGCSRSSATSSPASGAAGPYLDPEAASTSAGDSLISHFQCSGRSGSGATWSTNATWWVASRCMPRAVSTPPVAARNRTSGSPAQAYTIARCEPQTSSTGASASDLGDATTPGHAARIRSSSSSLSASVGVGRSEPASVSSIRTRPPVAASQSPQPMQRS